MTSAKEAMLTVAGADSFGILTCWLDALKIKSLWLFIWVKLLSTGFGL